MLIPPMLLKPHIRQGSTEEPAINVGGQVPLDRDPHPTDDGFDAAVREQEENERAPVDQDVGQAAVPQRIDCETDKK